MRSHELRDRFLKFFEQRGHAIVPSDSLIPSGDPTVLFTSAGMNQFKDCFLGKRTDLTRAASCQKCLRTGDLDNVGKTPSHHSFFEMLGNFSFGDYFKAEAIQWAWEFLTGTLDFDGTTRSTTPNLCLNLKAERLWVSVYEEDDEARRLWRALGVPEERIRPFGASENFWPANAPTQGPNGPCGPCSEIYYDPDGTVAGPRSVEVWNLVFTQFDRQSDGTLKPLPKPNIDTGMGLERLARVIQGKDTDYETDLFDLIINAIRQWPRHSNAKAKTDQMGVAERIIADHLRAIVFLVADGVRPSNESRGYVLRMLIRRASRFCCEMLGMDPAQWRHDPGGAPANFLGLLVDDVRIVMTGSPYHDDLLKSRALIGEVVDKEETQFMQTLVSGTGRLDAVIDALQQSNRRVIPGEEAFRLHDTYGFPLELTVDIAGERGFTVDRAGFEQALKAQQARSRAASQFGEAVFVPTTLTLGEGVKSEFIGYQALEADTTIQGIWKDGQWAASAREGDEVGVVLDRSPLYGEAGGQVGDRGMIECPRGLLEVLGTTWADALLIHKATVRQGTVSVNEPVRAKVDEARRLKIARSHTAAHMLHWALRKVLGPETVQAGSLVEVERVRFDFSTLSGLHEEQRLQVEQLVNERIRASDQVQTTMMKLEDAKRAGALALFGEKYGQQVRVVSIGDYSRELCGGTHLIHTGSIGLFRIVDESSIAAGTRRIEAVVGESALARQQQESHVLRRVAERFSRPPLEALQGLEELLQQLKAAEKALNAVKGELARIRAKELVAEAKRLDGVTLVAAAIERADRDLLVALADAIRAALTTDGVVLLAASEGKGHVAWVMAVTTGLAKRVHAGQLLNAIARITQGTGGGRPEFAQAGGKDPSRIPEALQRAEAIIHEALGR
ncbi:MAG: alanine--tRNA ligase [Candidatus Omnitrophota bacterium]|nr:alanine--tRNA ligase [Candidatus Omnitrophota bacterium]